MIGLRNATAAWLREGSDDRIALSDPARDRTISYAELRALVVDRAGELGLSERSLVVLTGARSLEFVVTYLALLDAGHVPLLAGDHADEMTSTWEPAALVRADHDGIRIERRGAAAIDLHPELALLLSTSGSTGSPKLVRLSHGNLIANARAIATFLRLGPDDQGITTLPLHYCYGLSVLHSHLSVGAGVTLTAASVVDSCFRDALVHDRVTNVAGVPHTFDLLERSDPERIRVPSLRVITQAGGRLAPDRVRAWADRAASWSAEFFVMYGQTEATARMAYLPPELARRRPESIGVPIPGGRLSVRPLGPDEHRPELGDGVGELVYEGPNVMLGYARDVDDLGRGREVDELATGDLARFHADDGVFEIVGRLARFIKPFGVRIDLDTIERLVPGAVATGDDERLVLAVPGADVDTVRELVTARTGLPDVAVVVDARPDVPRAAAGKPDYPAIRERASELAPASESHRGDPVDASPVATVFGSVLGVRGVRSDDTFVGLGGDSLSYVECSIRLDRALGHVPENWHLRPVAELDAVARPAGRRLLTRVDTTTVLRAVSIVAVVATHMWLWRVPGGAHILLAVVGFNTARFLLPIDDPRARFRAGIRTVGRVAGPTVAWVAAGLLFTNAAFGIGTLLLVNNYVGPAGHQGDHWHFWFIEVFVQTVVLTLALFAIPAARRAERRRPFAFPLALLAVTVVLRTEWFWFDDWFNFRYRTHSIAWFFVLGWLIQRSDTVRLRLVSTALCLALVPGSFDQPNREWFVGIALVALVWFREVPLPRLFVRPLAALASASMWILITHFTVWPPYTDAMPLGLAFVATLATGVAAWAGAESLIPRSIRLIRSTTGRGPTDRTLPTTTDPVPA